jgi:hypothetical protein
MVAGLVDAETSIQVRREGDSANVCIVGMLTMTEARWLRHHLVQLVSEGVVRLDLDLGRVSATDRIGVAALVLVGRRLRTVGGGLRFTAVSADCELALRQHHLFVDELDRCLRGPS